MIHNIPPEPTIKYLLDILRINTCDFPDCLKDYLRPIFQLAVEQRIYHYLAAWSLDRWNEALSPDLRSELIHSLNANKTRNALLCLQMLKLAQLFKHEDIPLIFLKGAAGLIRGLYPFQLRFLSDLDVLVPNQFLDKSCEVIRAAGYIPDFDSEPPTYHQHIVPYYHPEYAAGIEVHTDPYGLSFYERPVMPNIWRDAELVKLKNEPLTVPSITDHVWILIRTDLLPRVYLPRICDAIEITFILKKGYSIDFDLLMKRAERDNVSNIVKGMSYTCSKYMGIEPFVPIDDSLLKHWEDWSLEFQRKLLSKTHFSGSRKRFGTLTFITNRGIVSKIRLFIWLIRYEFLEDISSTGVIRGLQPVLKLWRIVKNICTYMIIAAEYIWLRFIRWKFTRSN